MPNPRLKVGAVPSLEGSYLELESTGKSEPLIFAFIMSNLFLPYRHFLKKHLHRDLSGSTHVLIGFRSGSSWNF